MMTHRLQDGFKNQVLTVIPRRMVDECRTFPLLEELYLTDVGFFPHAQYHYRTRPTGCEQHILIYCIQGRGFVEAENRRLTVDKNMVLLIPPGVPHIYGSEEVEPWHIYWAHFTGKRAHLYNQGPRHDISITPVSFGKAPLLLRLFDNIFDVLDQGITLPNLVYASHTLGHLLAAMFFLNSDPRQVGPATATDIDRHARQVNDTIAYLQEHINENVTLEELAAWNHLSKSQLTLIFKDKTGYAPINFFINLKMQQACRYLDLTDMTVQQIAAVMGYKDPYYFSRCFARAIGMPPSTYRLIKKG